MSQKLTRTINLPKAPASFTDEQKRYMDDFARALIGQFRDMFDLLGEDAGSLEKHMGDVTAHKMSEGNTASVGVIRTAEGKIRFTSADGTEETDDYGVSAGYVSPALEHIGLSEGIHGATATPTADRIAVFSSGGRLKGASPTEANDLVNKAYLSGQIVANKMTVVYQCFGNSAVTAGYPIEFNHLVEDRTVQLDGAYFTIPAGKYIFLVNIPGNTFHVYNQTTGINIADGAGCMAQIIDLAAQAKLCVTLVEARTADDSDVNFTPSISVISM